MRRHLVVFFCVVILIVTHHVIFSRERLIRDGQIVLLRLAPVDPRSLMQGDYMRLRFAVEDELPNSMRENELGIAANKRGVMVFSLNDENVAIFERIGDIDEGLANNEIRMRFRVRAGRLEFASNAYFFEEGKAKLYENALFGEFRVDADGTSVLTYLRDAELQRLVADENN